ncbi:MAG: ParA family protein [Thermofilum sp.]|jgi:cellulose biosynthesis protein BcsQ|uniref:ParA family protein n=1 Tax=Thermofilum sp. TaxID=1961369 RepID=UPI002589A9B2|nr:ParA family protein [Thermofilum sp.]MCI4408595.1 ParA family protein [Thermofilum sp.]
MTKVITVHNFKGGVGKTTATAILAMGLAAMGKKVLLIDFDAQMSLTQIFVKEEDRLKILESSTDVVQDRSSFAMLRTIEPMRIKFIHEGKGMRFDIDIIPGSYMSIFKLMFEGYIPIQSEWNILRMLDLYKGYYDYILIDTAPSDVITIKPILRATQYLLIPEDGTPEAFNAMRIFLNEALPKYILPKPEGGLYKYPRILGVILTKVRKTATSMLMRHNKILEDELKESVLRDHVIFPPYFGADKPNPEDYILSSRKEYLSDLIWRDEKRAPISDVFDRLFLVDDRAQKDLFAFFSKVFVEIPKEVLRRVENDRQLL